MVCHAADAIRLATRIARDRGEIGVEFRARVEVEEWAAFLRAEDDVDDDEAQGLWHGDGSGFQPSFCFRSLTWGVAPGWDGDAPLALSESPFQTASIVVWMRSRLAAISDSKRAISFW